MAVNDQLGFKRCVKVAHLFKPQLKRECLAADAASGECGQCGRLEGIQAEISIGFHVQLTEEGNVTDISGQPGGNACLSDCGKHTENVTAFMVEKYARQHSGQREPGNKFAGALNVSGEFGQREINGLRLGFEQGGGELFKAAGFDYHAFIGMAMQLCMVLLQRLDGECIKPFLWQSQSGLDGEMGACIRCAKAFGNPLLCRCIGGIAGVLRYGSSIKNGDPVADTVPKMQMKPCSICGECDFAKRGGREGSRLPWFPRGRLFPLGKKCVQCIAAQRIERGCRNCGAVFKRYVECLYGKGGAACFAQCFFRLCRFCRTAVRGFGGCTGNTNCMHAVTGGERQWFASAGLQGQTDRHQRRFFAVCEQAGGFVIKRLHFMQRKLGFCAKHFVTLAACKVSVSEAIARENASQSVLFGRGWAALLV